MARTRENGAPRKGTKRFAAASRCKAEPLNKQQRQSQRASQRDTDESPFDYEQRKFLAVNPDCEHALKIDVHVGRGLYKGQYNLFDAHLYKFCIKQEGTMLGAVLNIIYPDQAEALQLVCTKLMQDYAEREEQLAEQEQQQTIAEQEQTGAVDPQDIFSPHAYYDPSEGNKDWMTYKFGSSFAAETVSINTYNVYQDAEEPESEQPDAETESMGSYLPLYGRVKDQTGASEMGTYLQTDASGLNWGWAPMERWLPDPSQHSVGAAGLQEAFTKLDPHKAGHFFDGLLAKIPKASNAASTIPGEVALAYGTARDCVQDVQDNIGKTTRADAISSAQLLELVQGWLNHHRPPAVVCDLESAVQYLEICKQQAKGKAAAASHDKGGAGKAAGAGNVKGGAGKAVGAGHTKGGASKAAMQGHDQGGGIGSRKGGAVGGQVATAGDNPLLALDNSLIGKTIMMTYSLQLPKLQPLCKTYGVDAESDVTFFCVGRVMAVSASTKGKGKIVEINFNNRAPPPPGLLAVSTGPGRQQTWFNISRTSQGWIQQNGTAFTGAVLGVVEAEIKAGSSTERVLQRSWVQDVHAGDIAEYEV